MQNVDKLKNPINRESGEEKVKCGKKAAVVSGSSGQSLSDSELDKRGAEGIDERIPGFMHCMLGGSGSDSSDVSPVSPFQLDGGEARLLSPQFLLDAETSAGGDVTSVTPETRSRLEALLEAAGIGKSADSSRVLADPEVLRKLTSSVSSALDEAAAALTRMRTDTAADTSQPSLVDACQHGNVPAVRRLLDEGSSVNETTDKGESLLSLACHSGYYELAQVLLAMRANVEDRGMKGDCTPLMEAATAGHVDVVKLLIKHKADVNAQSSSGNTPLMYACSGGHVEVVRALLEAGANIEDANENGHTPLMEAASAGHVEVAQILLDHGAGINTHSNEFKESALTLACYKGHLDMVRFLLAAGADQEHKTEEMHTALMEASMDGHVEVARLLLDSGAQVNMPADSFESPLTLAACGGHVELALLLLDRGANIEEVNDEGYTPLMEAAREGHEDMVALLLSQEANINAITEETQETALTLACCGGFLEVADFLIQAGADIELGASTPLMEAAQEGHLELVKFLIGLPMAGRYVLERGANVNAVTQTGGDTALTYACENGHTAVAEVLLEKHAHLPSSGADLEHAAEGGRTALMKAARAGHLCTVTFLLSRNADVNRTTTSNDHTALSLACHGGHLHVVKVLLQHGANPNHILKDNSTMLMEAAKNGHTQVVELLMDYPDITPLTEAQMPGAFEPADEESAAARVGGAHAQSDLALNVNAARQYQGDGASVPIDLLPPPAAGISDPSTASATAAAPTPATPGAASAAKPACQRRRSRSAGQEEAIAQYGEDIFTMKTPPYTPSSPVMGQPPVEEDVDFIESILAGAEGGLGRAASDRLERYLSEMLGRPDVGDQGEEIEKLTNLTKTLASRMPEDLRRSFQVLPGLAETAAGPAAEVSANSAVAAAATVVTVAAAAASTAQSRESVIVSNPSPSPLPASVAPPEQRPKAKPVSKKDAKKQPRQPAPASKSVSAGVTVPVQSAAVAQLTSAAQLAANQQQLAALQQNVAALQQLEQTVMAQRQLEQKAGGSAAGQQLHQRQQIQLLQQRKQLQQQIKQFQQQVEHQLMHTPHLPPYPPSGEEPPPPPPPPPAEEESAAAGGKRARQWTAADVANWKSFLYPEPTEAEMVELGRVAATPPAAAAAATAKPPAAPQGVKRREGSSSPCRGGKAAAPSSVVSSSPGMVTNTGLLDGDASQGSSTAGLQFTGLNTQGLQVAPPSGIQRQYQQLQAAAAYQAHLGMPTQQIQLLQTQLTMPGQYVPGLPLELTPGQLAASAAGLPLELTPSQLAAGAAQLPLELAPGQLELAAAAAAQAIPLELATSDLPPPQPAAAAPGDKKTKKKQNNRLQQQQQQQIQQMQQIQQRYHQHQLQIQQQQLAQSPPHALLVPTDPVTAGYASPPLTDAELAAQSAAVAAQLPPSSSGAANAGSGLMVAAPARTLNDTLYRTGVEQAELTAEQVADFSRGYLQGTLHGLAVNSLHDCPPPQPLSGVGPALPQPGVPVSAVSGAAPYVGGAATTDQLNSETESNHDTALTLACAGGHEELVQLLLKRGAHIEHRDKKGFTPLILAATAGHAGVVEILLAAKADIEAQSERTKDTPLSLACSGGRYEVVEILLRHNANKEHRNVSDYTPLSLAASGGYVNIIKLLLQHGAEINSRTGSKLGISPLMLAAMNGHTAAVRLLLEMGSDINAQIETNRNTALTLACFQGRHEVVQLLVDRRAYVEHRAKTGLTPLMEAASGGYVEVGRVLLDKFADVNAAPVPSSRDTALTIAADKGHYKFVELLVTRGAQAEVRNKKGNTPLWLAANGGHLDVVQLLFHHNANIDAQDNRKVSCLMAAYRRGHVKVVKWMVKFVTQFPSDTELLRYLQLVSDKELAKKCQACVEIIRVAKERQAAEANRNATSLLEQLAQEDAIQKQRQCLAAKKRDKKKKKRQSKQPNKDDDESGEEDDVLRLAAAVVPPAAERDSPPPAAAPAPAAAVARARCSPERDSGFDATSQSSTSSGSGAAGQPAPAPSNGATGGGKRTKREEKRRRQLESQREKPEPAKRQEVTMNDTDRTPPTMAISPAPVITEPPAPAAKTRRKEKQKRLQEERERMAGTAVVAPAAVTTVAQSRAGKKEKPDAFTDMATFEERRLIPGLSVRTASALPVGLRSPGYLAATAASSPKKGGKGREEGWREVTARSASSSSRTKRVTVPTAAISRVIGRGGSNVNAIRDQSGAHVEIEKKSKGQADRVITIKGSAEAVKMAHSMITDLAESPDADVSQLLGRYRPHHGGQTGAGGQETAAAAGKTAQPRQQQSGGQAAAKAALQALTDMTFVHTGVTMSPRRAADGSAKPSVQRQLNMGAAGTEKTQQQSRTGQADSSNEKRSGGGKQGGSGLASSRPQQQQQQQQQTPRAATPLMQRKVEPPSSAAGGRSRSVQQLPVTSEQLSQPTAVAAAPVSSQAPPPPLQTYSPFNYNPIMKNVGQSKEKNFAAVVACGVSSLAPATSTTVSFVDAPPAVALPDASKAPGYQRGSGNAPGADRPGAGAVGSDRPGSNAVGSERSTMGAVGSERQGAGAVGSDRPSMGAVGSDRPNVGAVGSERPSVGAVGSDRPAPGAVGSDRPGVGAVGSERPSAGAVGSDRPSAGAVGSDRPNPGAVGSDRPGVGAVGSERSGVGAVGSDRPSAGAVGSDRPSAGAVGSDRPSAVGSERTVSSAVGAERPQQSSIQSQPPPASVSPGGAGSGSPQQQLSPAAGRSAPGTPVVPMQPPPLAHTPPLQPTVQRSVSSPDWSLAPGGPLNRPPPAPPSAVPQQLSAPPPPPPHGFLDMNILRSRLPPAPIGQRMPDASMFGSAAPGIPLPPLGLAPGSRPREHTVPPPLGPSLLDMFNTPPPPSVVSLHHPPPNIIKHPSALPRPIGVERSMRDRHQFQHQQQQQQQQQHYATKPQGRPWEYQTAHEVDNGTASWLSGPPPPPAPPPGHQQEDMPNSGYGVDHQILEELATLRRAATLTSEMGAAAGGGRFGYSNGLGGGLPHASGGYGSGYGGLGGVPRQSNNNGIGSLASLAGGDSWGLPGLSGGKPNPPPETHAHQMWDDGWAG